MKRCLVALALSVATSPMVAAQHPPPLIVEEIAPDSAAAKAGLAVSDRLVSYNGRPLPSPAALQALEQNTFDIPQVTLGLRRGGDLLTLTVPRGALGIRVRPVLSAGALTLYEEGKRSQAAKHGDAVVARWLEAAKAAPDTAAAAWLYGLVGELHHRERRWKEAHEAHAAAWALLSETGDPAARSRTLTALGLCSENQNDHPAALQWYEQALAVDEAAGHEEWVAGDLTSLGLLTHARGNLESGQDYHHRALTIRQRLIPDSLAVAASLNSLGNSAYRRGDHAAAHDLYSRALAIRERLAPDSLDVAGSLSNLGNIAFNRGDLTAAQDYHSRSLAIRQREAPDSVAMSTGLASLGLVAKARGDLEAAEDYQSRTVAIRERLAPDSLLLANSLNNLGMVVRSAGRYAAAHALHRRALEIRERLAPDSLIVAASLDSLGNLAQLLGDPAAARDYFERTLAMQDRLAPNSLESAETLGKLGGLALNDRRFPDALALFTRAVDIVEAQRSRIPSADQRALLLARVNESYAGLLRAHLELGDVPAAFAAAERARARSLLESLSESRTEIRHGVDSALLTKERHLQQRINAQANRQTQLLADRDTAAQAAQADQELNALLLQYRDLQAEIRATSPRYAVLTQPRPLGLAEIQREVLDNGTLLLEYALGDDGSHLFAVTTTSIERFALPPRAEIEQAARRVYATLIARQSAPGETPAQRRARVEKADADGPAAAAALSRMLLGPIAGQLSGQRLLIVADGALQYVPFAALPRPGQAGTTNAEPLVVRHEIVSLPSASIIAVLRGERRVRPATDRAVAVVADPVFDKGDSRLRRPGSGAPPPSAGSPLPAEITRGARAAGLTDERGVLARLPFSREEADAIVALAPAGGSARAVDFRASRATLASREVSRARIVHLATHGLLDADRPELSGLVLSLYDEQGRPQDGFLRLHELYNLGWSAELVVLSACQTALGQEIRGEGLVGLTRGFMYGGAERVMASLWSVNDSATAQFMTQFYEGLFSRKLSPAAALRAAQIEMWRRKSSRQPYYWAAFVLQGDWR